MIKKTSLITQKTNKLHICILIRFISLSCPRTIERNLSQPRMRHSFHFTPKKKNALPHSSIFNIYKFCLYCPNEKRWLSSRESKTFFRCAKVNFISWCNIQLGKQTDLYIFFSLSFFFFLQTSINFVKFVCRTTCTTRKKNI